MTYKTPVVTRTAVNDCGLSVISAGSQLSSLKFLTASENMHKKLDDNYRVYDLSQNRSIGMGWQWGRKQNCQWTNADGFKLDRDLWIWD